jgi:hypothetical protein
MIPLEGRLLAGLDEFMLRLGHVKVLCAAATENRGSSSRIVREAAALLTRPVRVPEESMPAVTTYLLEKRLCPMSAETAGGSRQSAYRYPDLLIVEGSSGPRLASTQGDARIWWQDLCLAHPQVRSRVGAITVTKGKSGSKTGLSHIYDWSSSLDLITSVGELTPEGRLLARLAEPGAPQSFVGNPYVIGSERIVLAFQFLSADFDVFCRLATRIVQRNAVIRKADGTRLFAETIQQIADEADHARHLTSGRQFRISQHLRDLETAVRRAGVRTGELWSSSTAWHRTASRLESYVDLGLLQKGVGGDHEKYEYVYYRTDALERCVATFASASSAEDWLESQLASCLFGASEPRGLLDAEELRQLVRRITAALERPTAPLPITALSLGLSWLKADAGETLSVGEARRSIEELARREPELARLSRGHSGERAEFVSFGSLEVD